MQRLAKIGVAIFTAQSVALRLVQLAAQIILAKLISPETFGVVGLALVFINISTSALNFGIDDLVVQRGRKSSLWFGKFAAFNIALSVLLFLVILAVAPVAGHAYNNVKLFWLLLLMAAGLPISAMCIVPIARLRSEFRFGHLATIGFFDVAGLQGLTIALALMGFSEFSFALPMLIVPLFKLIYLQALRLVPKPKIFGRRTLRAILKRAGYIFSHRVLIGAIGQLDVAILGLFAAQREVGYYVFAFKIASQPLSFLAGNISHVLFPILRSFNGDRIAQQKAADIATRALGVTMYGAAAFQAFMAPSFVHALFNGAWDGSIGFIQILSVGLALDAFNWVAGALLLARGEFRRQLKFTSVFFVFFIAIVGCGANIGGGIGVAVSVALYYALIGPILLWRVTGASISDLSRICGLFFTPLIVAALTYGSGWVLIRRWDAALDLVICGIIALTCTGLFFFSMMAIDPILRRLIFSLARSLTKRIRLVGGER